MSPDNAPRQNVVTTKIYSTSHGRVASSSVTAVLTAF